MNGNFRVGDFLIEPQINTIVGAEKATRIEPKVMQVLLRLAEQAGEVVPKEKLMQSVWSDTFVTDDVLTRSISELRKVFEDDAKDSRFIQTVPRNGYRLIAPLSDADVKPGDHLSCSHALDAFVPDVPQVRSRRGHLIWIASLSALVIATGLFLYLQQGGSENTPSQLRVVDLTSLVGTKMTPAFSSDGNQIAFAWNRTAVSSAEIYVELIGEGEPRQLTNSGTGTLNFSPVWSPDNKKIAFVRCSENEASLFTISAYGQGERKLLTFNSRVFNRGERKLSWSPDGKFIAFADSDENLGSTAIFLFSPDTFQKQPLTSPPEGFYDEGPSFSPGDTHLLGFVRCPISDPFGFDLYVVPVSGGEPNRLTFGYDLWRTGPAWTEDGAELIFSSRRTGTSALWRIPVKGGGNPQRLEVGSEDSTAPAISRKGHLLAYHRFAADYNIYRVVLEDDKKASNSPAAILVSTRVDAGAQVSPDGKRITFQSNRSSHGASCEIWVCDIEGYNCARTTSFGTMAELPRWSPDGTRIVCQSNRDGKTSVDIIDIKTRAVHRLLEDPVRRKGAQLVARWAVGLFRLQAQRIVGDLEVACKRGRGRADYRTWGISSLRITRRQICLLYQG